VPCRVLAASLHRPVSLPLSPLLRTVLVSVAVAVVAFVALDLLDVIASVFFGVLVGLAAALVLRPLSFQDASWLTGALGTSGVRGHAARVVAPLRALS
jgi:hypothetical protein